LLTASFAAVPIIVEAYIRLGLAESKRGHWQWFSLSSELNF